MKTAIQKLLVVIFITSNTISYAQHFPNQMHLSPDGKRLIVGNSSYCNFYQLSTIHNINLQFTSPTYWTTLTNNFPNRVDMPCVMTIDGTVYDSTGVRFKGNSSYSAIGTAPKKSFNIGLDDFVPGQNVAGYNTLVLNNCFDDPSFIREVFYEQEISKHVPSPEGNLAHLYINGQNWGLYSSVEQLNHDYLKNWFLSHDGALWRARNPHGSPGPGGGNGDSLCSLYNFGTDTVFYKNHYTLKSSGVVDPYVKLMTFIQVLDTVSPNTMEAVLSSYLDIDRTIWFLASEDAFVDDDSYLFKGRKDYYLYYEAETGRMVPLEMDGNDALDPTLSSLSIFFNLNNSNLPLIKKILNVPYFHQRYLAHMRTIVKDEMDSTEYLPVLNSYYALIDTMVQNDPKKLYTYADFVNELPVLKTFMRNRQAYIKADPEFNIAGPSISNVVFYTNGQAWNRPTNTQDVWVRANITSANGLDHVSLYSATQLVGKFTKVDMVDDGLHHDSLAGDGIFGASIPPNPGATWVRFYVEAAANDSVKTVSYEPVGAEHDVYTYLVLPQHAQGIDSTVVINEIMAKNITSATDSAGEHDDWIELYNTLSTPKDISGYYLTEHDFNLMKWKIPAGTIIPGYGYLIIWADENESQGKFHTNFQLSSTHGEHLMLLTPNEEIADQVTFGAQPADQGYARVLNGTGSFINQDPTFSSTNNSIPHAHISANANDCTGQAVNFSNMSLNGSTFTWDFGDASSQVNTYNASHVYTNTGSFTVKLIATTGSLTDTAFLPITVSTSPVFNFTADTVNTPNLNYQLDAGPGFAEYLWSTNETTQGINVTSSGMYCVVVSNASFCTDTDCIYVFVNNTGIENISDNKIEMYPNPADSKMEFITSANSKNDFVILNSLGKEIYKNSFINKFTLDTHNWSEGVYYFKEVGIVKSFVVKH